MEFTLTMDASQGWIGHFEKLRPARLTICGVIRVFVPAATLHEMRF